MNNKERFAGTLSLNNKDSCEKKVTPIKMASESVFLLLMGTNEATLDSSIYWEIYNNHANMMFTEKDELQIEGKHLLTT